MKPVAFSREETADIVGKLRVWFRDELDQELSGLQGEMLLDVLNREIGPFFYTRGLRDAQTVVTAKVEDIADAIYVLERDDAG